MTSIIKVDQIQNAAGTAGLTIDSNGVVTKGALPAFHVRKTSQQTATANRETVVWEAEDLDQNNDFSSNTFTAPVDGVYSFCCFWLSPNTTTQFDLMIVKNGSGALARSRNAGVAYHETTSMSWVGLLDANDAITVQLEASGDVIYGDTSNPWSAFMGYLIG